MPSNKPQEHSEYVLLLSLLLSVISFRSITLPTKLQVSLPSPPGTSSAHSCLSLHTTHTSLSVEDVSKHKLGAEHIRNDVRQFIHHSRISELFLSLFPFMPCIKFKTIAAVCGCGDRLDFGLNCQNDTLQIYIKLNTII